MIRDERSGTQKRGAPSSIIIFPLDLLVLAQRLVIIIIDNIIKCIMKLACFSAALALATGAFGFAPAPGASLSTSSRATSLNLLGSRWLSDKISGKADADITEKEVRALFELWNQALATGDSRIVASRYTKVSL